MQSTPTSLWFVAGWLTVASTPTDALPHYLLQRECHKGFALVNRSGPLPAIMTAVPDVDPSLLAMFEAPPPRDQATSVLGAASSFFSFHSEDVIPMPPIQRGAAVRGGARIELVYNGSYAGHATHIAFVVDAGVLHGSVPCGDTGARMLCTTCGDDEAWLKSSIWTVPVVAGPVTAAVAVGHSGLGTPAVRLARFTIDVLPRSGEALSAKARHGTES
eukprot:m.455851 g.455851  ORF g.455851 m.455851 type:complete len:217 (-) comp20945_c0_seq1:74-724(-)